MLGWRDGPKQPVEPQASHQLWSDGVRRARIWHQALSSLSLTLCRADCSEVRARGSPKLQGHLCPAPATRPQHSHHPAWCACPHLLSDPSQGCGNMLDVS